MACVVQDPGSQPGRHHIVLTLVLLGAWAANLSPVKFAVPCRYWRRQLTPSFVQSDANLVGFMP